jgi:hypothetical protein
MRGAKQKKQGAQMWQCGTDTTATYTFYIYHNLWVSSWFFEPFFAPSENVTNYDKHGRSILASEANYFQLSNYKLEKL